MYNEWRVKYTVQSLACSMENELMLESVTCFPVFHRQWVVNSWVQCLLFFHHSFWQHAVCFILPVALCILPSSVALYRNSTLGYWLRVINSHSSTASCKRILLFLFPFSPFYSHASASLSMGVGIQGVCFRKLRPLRGSGNDWALFIPFNSSS